MVQRLSGSCGRRCGDMRWSTSPQVQETLEGMAGEPHDLPDVEYHPIVSTVQRVLDLEPVADLADHLSRCGGDALVLAASTDPIDLIGAVTDAGLRGRGGAGFPTGVKWQTVADNRSVREPTAVVVNAAEGEPGTFKDRAILRANPYRVLEGALIAARAVGAPEVVVALKASFEQERARVQHAIDELSAAGLDDVSMRIAVGPASYLFGVESAMLDDVGLAHRPLHEARHAAASLMLSEGVPLKVVSETLGHSTITLTADRYGHLMPDDSHRAAAAIDSALGA